MHDVQAAAALFVGESATMASESVVLGTPSIYIDEVGRGYTDEEAREGLLWMFRPVPNRNSLIIEDQKNTEKNTELSADTDSIQTVTTPQSACVQASRQPDDPFRSTDIVAQSLPDNSVQKTQKIFSDIEDAYNALPKYGFIEQCKLFCAMLMKAFAYSRCIYWLTMRMKKSSNPNVHEQVTMRQMAPGIRRLYRSALPEIPAMIEKQKQNAEAMKALVIGNWKLENGDWMVGENAFMAIIRTDDVAAAKADFAKRGIETETHFARCIEWAKVFGYKKGSCPNAERLTKELLMIPTYRQIFK